MLKKRILDLGYKQGLSFEKSKDRDKLRASKTRKSVRKASETQRGYIIKIVLMMQKYARTILTFG